MAFLSFSFCPPGGRVKEERRRGVGERKEEGGNI
jgi:hypothetical protein